MCVHHFHNIGSGDLCMQVTFLSSSIFFHPFLWVFNSFLVKIILFLIFTSGYFFKIIVQGCFIDFFSVNSLLVNKPKPYADFLCIKCVSCYFSQIVDEL